MLVYSKRGQLTIFIILGVLVVAGVVLAVVLTGDSEDSDDSSGGQSVQNPSAFLRGCMENNFRETLQKMRLRGGFLDASPSISFRFVNDTNPVSRDIAYLCYAESSGNACVVQNVALVGGMERELKNEMEEVSQECFSNLKSSYRDNGYDVSGGSYDPEEDFSVDLVRDEARLVLNASEMVLQRTNETRNLNEFKFEVPTVAYKFAKVANKIVEQEVESGSVSIGQFAIDYPDFRLDYEVTPDQSRIYTLTHVDTGNKFRFATRSYPLP